MTAYTKNIVTDYSAPTDGTSDSSTAWTNFGIFCSGLAAGDSVTLTVPSHTYTFAADQGVPLGGNGVLGGITVTVNATSCAFTGNFGLGLPAVGGDNTHSSRIASVNAGATSVFLVTPAENSRYQVLQWIMVTGLDLQGFGEPPNPAFFEYRQITAINAGTGEISFATPLAQQYLSTWPLFSTGDATHSDLGGPATIYAMPPEWDLDATYNFSGTTLDRTGGIQIYAKIRKVTVNGGQPLTNGIIPSVNQSITFNSVNQSGVSVELDKLNELVVYNGGSVSQIESQSPGCATQLILNNFTASIINGTPRNLTMTGCTVTTELRIGVTAYGRSDSVTANNNSIAAISTRGANSNDLITNYTMTNGVLKYAKSNGPATWATPGGLCFFVGNQANELGCRVNYVIEDGTYSYIGLSIAGGVPDVPLDAGVLRIQSHPCPIWYGTGNTGCVDAIDLSQAGAQGRPIYSYSKRTYTGANSGTMIGLASPPQIEIWGKLVSVKATVSQAYTGSQGTLTAECLGSFGGNFVTADHTTLYRYDPVIDLKTTGVRTVTLSANTGSVGIDVLGTAQGGIWFSGLQDMAANHDVSGEASGLWPVIEVEIITDQQFPASVMPLRFRLHG